MRALFAVLIVTACARPAMAQDSTLDARYEAIWQEQQAANQMARQRSVALENKVGALEAQMQTETRLREAQPPAPRLATPDNAVAGPVVELPSNIAVWMAQSNARVRAAAANRR
ncbi:MAG: hypothetical protein KA085_04340 [Phenylobacterium sp.]|uniref:hypothetical protein n=1 Tax=Phenylobacterium sp. TaxID=1871053 RepID=UPI001B6ECDA6|nr:hypothetical protein [Phenylobacterium sp.]MBP7649333.1 hypothetical protein [Phenylobacterium sp.]MBP7815329.1 hypothetical protein [Phenylobacterium sp.]MBP9231389.1 hypothetical protein [Phenylobacterium sp.]